MTVEHGTFGNLRDLGGLPTTDGRRVREATLLRSESLTTLDPASVARLGAVPVRLVYDLRSAGEHEPPAGVWSGGGHPEVVNIELIERDQVEGDDLLVPMMRDTSGSLAREYMFGFYRSVAERLAAGPLADFSERVARRSQVPVVVHCTAGQDRTGVMIALILLALGVPRHAVLADYMVTLNHFGEDRMRAWFLERYSEDEIDWRALAPFLVAEEYLEATIDGVVERWGSIEGYWDAAGVDGRGLADLRDALLADR